MFSKFLNTKPEKQERILQAAIKEFADKGFEKSSTNEIVREAEISKGILFHYFQNKKKLFLFVFDYCVELCMDEFDEKIDEKEKDIFEKLRQIATFKMELLHKYPDIFKFFEVAIGDESIEIKSDIEQRKQKLTESNYKKVFNNIDESKFCDGVDVSKAINIIMWSLDGFGTSELQKAKVSPSKGMDYGEVFHEMDIYIDIFKNCFYK